MVRGSRGTAQQQAIMSHPTSMIEGIFGNVGTRFKAYAKQCRTVPSLFWYYFLIFMALYRLLSILFILQLTYQWRLL